jgi:hypothetical protein
MDCFIGLRNILFWRKNMATQSRKKTKKKANIPSWHKRPQPVVLLDVATNASLTRSKWMEQQNQAWHNSAGGIAERERWRLERQNAILAADCRMTEFEKKMFDQSTLEKQLEIKEGIASRELSQEESLVEDMSELAQLIWSERHEIEPWFDRPMLPDGEEQCDGCELECFDNGCCLKWKAYLGVVEEPFDEEAMF